MHFSLFNLALLSTSGLALEAVTNTDSFDELSRRGYFVNKRQVYAPNTTSCGQGGSCFEACGRDQVECPSSNPWILYCHSATDGSTCCPGGYSCHAGFYCSSDSNRKAYCCPNNTSTSECAGQYSLTGSLIPAPSTAVVSSFSTLAVTTIPASFVQASIPVLASVFPSTSVSSGQFNATATSPLLPQFTGGSAKVMKSGIAMLASGAGLIFL